MLLDVDAGVLMSRYPDCSNLGDRGAFGVVGEVVKEVRSNILISNRPETVSASVVGCIKIPQRHRKSH